MRKYLTHAAWLIAPALLWPAAVRACDFCLLQQGISPLETLNGAGARVTQRYTLLNTVYQGTRQIPNPGTLEEYWTTDLSAFYSPTPGLLLMANLPYRVTHVDGHLHVHADRTVELHDDVGGDEGIGDLALLGRYTFFTHHTLDSSMLLAVTAGMKTPTGSTNGRTDDGEFLDAHTQLGTGSLDALFGVSFYYSLGRVSVSGNALANFAGEGEAGDQEHEFGDSVNYDVAARYRLFPSVPGGSATSLFASLGVGGEVRGRETEDGMRAVDSGGHTVYIVPGLQWNIGPHWTAEFSYRHAVHHDLNAIQLGEDYKVFGSLTYLF